MIGELLYKFTFVEGCGWIIQDINTGKIIRKWR